MLILQRIQRVHKEHFRHRVLVDELSPPVLANIAVLIGVRLDEQQPATFRRLLQFVTDTGRAIFLLRRDKQQHIAMRQHLSQTREIRAGGLPFRGIRVRAIDHDDVSQDR